MTGEARPSQMESKVSPTSPKRSYTTQQVTGQAWKTKKKEDNADLRLRFTNGHKEKYDKSLDFDVRLDLW